MEGEVNNYFLGSVVFWFSNKDNVQFHAFSDYIKIKH